MPKSDDPFYTRQRLPDEFIEYVGETGLTPQEELVNRERKYSATGQDIRKFDTKKNSGFHPQADPYYGRKPVPDTLIHGVGETGLTEEEELLNRERKYSVTGVDVRRFDTKPGSGFHPNNDPYYARKSVSKPSIQGVGETGMSKAEVFESRENKAHLFQDSADPFAIVTGRGHRASVSAAALPVSEAARRRSSAVAPDHAAAAAAATHAHGHHSGYGHEPLEKIESRREDNVMPTNEITGPTTTTTTTTQTTTHVSGGNTLGHGTGNTIGQGTGNTIGHGTDNAADNGGHTMFYQEATKDLDNVAPHERV